MVNLNPYPAILVIAHDLTCAIYATGACDCRPTRRVLVGDSERADQPKETRQ